MRKMNRYIILDETNKVVSIRFGKSIVEGEIESVSGELGQIREASGIFITPEIVLVSQPNEPTNSELAQMISDLQADLIIAGVI